MGLYVRLSRELTERLYEVSQRERRRPSDQAAILLEQVLRNDGANPLAECDVKEVTRVLAAS